MTTPEEAAVAALLLRLALGVMFLAHAWVKVKIFTPRAPPNISNRSASRVSLRI